MLAASPFSIAVDETLVAHDSRIGMVFDITDDEINRLLHQVSSRTPHVVLIFDSCHSGSAARMAATGSRARLAPRDTRTPPPPDRTNPDLLDVRIDITWNSVGGVTTYTTRTLIAE